MKRRTFLKNAAVIGGVAVVGIPDLKIPGVPDPDSTDTSSSSYYLHGNRRAGCALPVDYVHHRSTLPHDLISRLR